MRNWRMPWMVIAPLLAGNVHAQYWAPLGTPIEFRPQVNVVFGDTVWDRLLVGGNFKYLYPDQDSLEVTSIAAWDGQEWAGLADTIQVCNGNLCAPVWEFFRYKGELYANGSFGFYTADSLDNIGFARWNTVLQAWTELECPNDQMNGIATLVPLPPQETMYFTGYLGTLCGYDSSCVFTYDGDTITPFDLDDPLLQCDGNYVGYVFEYLGTTYVTGLLWDPDLQQGHSFMRWTGSELEDVPGWSTLDPIKDILIHDGQLYVCGWFFEATGGPGNMVARFDGQQWHTLGSGLTMTLAPSTGGVALDLHEWNDDIYVAGQFNYAGGASAINAARWNGNQWCGLGGLPYLQTDTGTAWSLTTWRDELYMAGAFVTIDGDTMWNVARWLGQVENCSEPVAVVEDRKKVQFTLLPSGDGQWTLVAPVATQGTLEIHDVQGRLLSFESAENGHVIDLHDRSPGIYIVRIVPTAGAAWSARVKR